MAKNEKDKQKEKGKRSVSRRGFLATGGAMIAGGALSAWGISAEGKETPEKKISSQQTGKEKSIVVGLGFCGPGAGSNTSVADIRDGKIIRIRPLHFDWKYNKEQFNPWKWEVKGKTFEPTMKSLIPPYSLSYKKRVYSPNRILYPLKRVDWDPNGKRNTQNRGKSKYKRISWNEALDIVVSEIKRIHKEYGPYAILPQWGGHGESKLVHDIHGYPAQFLELLGGFTQEVRNPDSWEGWYWGAKHVWGMSFVGQMAPSTNTGVDISEHSDMVLFWGCDPETTPWAFDGQMASRLCYFWSEVGIKHIYICPDLNYGAAVHADKWIPIRPGTDAALQLAIAYTWITEGTYDKDYVKTHAVGFDKFADYVLGKEDGIPKTPGWASTKCAIPEWTIKALARNWGSKVTSIAHGNGGPGIRSAYSTENGRLEPLLLCMQGLGKPGVHQVKMIEWWGFSQQNPMPAGVVMPMVTGAKPSYKTARFDMSEAAAAQGAAAAKAAAAKAAGGPPKEGGLPKDGGPQGKGGSKDTTGRGEMRASAKQFLPKNLVAEALLNAPISWYGQAGAGAETETQFEQYKYPAEGCSEIHMIWTDSPCWITCWNESNSFIKALRGPKIEFFLAQHPWMESDCLFADLILPVDTRFEDNDIDNDNHNGQFYMIIHQEQCIEKVGESVSAYELMCMIADRFGLKDTFTGGKSVKEWIKTGFDTSGAGKLISYEEWKEKGYFVVPTDPDWKKTPAGVKAFYEDPEKNRLNTPTGKIEFYSERLAKYFPDDKERPPMPKWIEKGITHDERVSSERAKKYPLLQISNHGRWRVHANNDDISWLRECPTCKVRGFDGYMYEPLWMNTQDAAARGIKTGDIVKIYNERGVVLGGAYVSERIMPGAVSMDHGARYDPIIPGELDRGGAINTITPGKTTSKNATGMVVSSFLVEVEKVTMAQMGEWRDKYPEAFERPYDPASGLDVKRVLA